MKTARYVNLAPTPMTAPLSLRVQYVAMGSINPSPARPLAMIAKEALISPSSPAAGVSIASPARTASLRAHLRAICASRAQFNHRRHSTNAFYAQQVVSWLSKVAILPIAQLVTLEQPSWAWVILPAIFAARSSSNPNRVEMPAKCVQPIQSISKVMPVANAT